jgi:hypothetical protein
MLIIYCAILGVIVVVCCLTLAINSLVDQPGFIDKVNRGGEPMGYVRKCIRCGKEFFQSDFEEDNELCAECKKL